MFNFFYTTANKSKTRKRNQKKDFYYHILKPSKEREKERKRERERRGISLFKKLTIDTCIYTQPQLLQLQDDDYIKCVKKKKKKKKQKKKPQKKTPPNKTNLIL